MSTVTTILAHEGADPPRLVRFVPRLVGHEKQHRIMTLVSVDHRARKHPGPEQGQGPSTRTFWTIREGHAGRRLHFHETNRGPEAIAPRFFS